MEVMISAAFTFILVMDPLGNVPLFLASLKNTAPERRQWVILRECLIALAVMISFLFAGRGLLNLLHVDDAALKAAGGVILLLISIRMVFPTPERNLTEPVTHDEPFIVPLAVPYMAGPSLLAPGPSATAPTCSRPPACRRTALRSPRCSGPPGRTTSPRASSSSPSPMPPGTTPPTPSSRAW